MASAYRLKADIDPYMSFTIDDLNVYKQMEDFDIRGFGQPLNFQWNAPKGIFLESDTGSKELPKLTLWAVKILIAHKDALHILRDVLNNEVVEIYNLDGSHSDYVLVNPVVRLGNEIVDLEKTQSSYFDDGAWEKLERLVLKSSVVQSAPPLFTLELERGLHLYCNEQFKTLVEDNCLTGLLFEVVELS